MSLKRKKLCFIVSSSLTAKAFLWNHLEALSADMDISLVGNFSEADKTLLSGLSVHKIHSIPIPRNILLFKDLRALFLLIHFFRKERFDFIHSVTPKAGLLSMIAGFLARIKTRVHIFTGQIWHTKTGWFRVTLKLLDKVIVLFSTHILVDGKGQMEYLIENGVVKRNDIRILANGSINGVDTKKFSPDHDQRSSVRQSLGISDNQIVILYLGRFNKDKGLLDLISAFNAINVEETKSILLLVGYDEENISKHAIETLKVGSYRIIGPTNNPVSFYQASDIFCLPSYREGFGTSVIEASSVGLAILCSDTYGLQETIIDNVTGIRHEVGNIEDISIKLTNLLRNSELRTKLGKNGRNYVIDNFQSDIVTKAWRNFYKEISG